MTEDGDSLLNDFTHRGDSHELNGFRTVFLKLTVHVAVHEIFVVWQRAND
jgi:hypothetical protein